MEQADYKSIGADELHLHQSCLLEVRALAEAAGDLALNSELVADLLYWLTAYCIEHFGAEERLMQEIEYPHFAEHRQWHSQMLDRVASLAVAATQKTPSVPANLLVLMRDMLEGESLRHDLCYVDHALANGITSHSRASRRHRTIVESFHRLFGPVRHAA